ncbi:MAG: hypothetical protein ACREUG_13485 [Steroidobacteraceae bacterium]
MQNVAYCVPGLCIREPRPREHLVAPGMPRMREHLVELIGRLRLAHSAATTSAAALRLQNCELDEDVARLLQRCVSDVLGEQIEETQEMLAAFGDASG